MYSAGNPEGLFMSGRRLMPTLFSLAAGLVLLAPSAVMAQGGGGGGAGGAGGAANGGQQNPLAIYQAAGASTDQLSKIKSMIEAFANAQQARGQAMWQLMKDMHALSLQPSPDPAAVMAKQDQINKANAEMANEKMKLMLAIRGSLSDDQKQKLVQLMQPQQTGSGGGSQ
jgi:Spy/CpxP family protein refolding chaperone